MDINLSPDTYTVLTTKAGSRDMAVVLPQDLSEEDAASALVEIESIHRMVAVWARIGTGESWAVNIRGDLIELYIPPAPGADNGTIMGLDEAGAEDMISGLAQALAALRAERRLRP